MSTRGRAAKRGKKQNRRSGNPAKRVRPTNGSAQHGPKPDDAKPTSDDDELRELLQQVADFHARTERNLAKALGRHPVELPVIAAECYSLVDHRVSAADQTIDEFLDGYLQVKRLPYDAAAYALATMSGDSDVRARVETAIGLRMDAFPAWLRRLSETRATDVWIGIDEVQAVATIGIGLRLATGEEATLLAMVDPEWLGEVVEVEIALRSAALVADDWRTHNPGCEVTKIAAADARARVESAIRSTIRRPDDNDGWRRRLVFIDWVLGLLPEGGDALPVPMIRDIDESAIVQQFLRSDLGAPYRDDPDSESIARACVEWHGMWIDPLRWSARAVTHFLLGQVPRWAPLGREYVIKVPPLLTAFIRYGHGIRGVSEPSTAEALDFVERCTPELFARLDQPDDGHRAQRLLQVLGAESPCGVDWFRAELDDAEPAYQSV